VVYRQIVVGVDDSDTAREAFRHACDLSAVTGAVLHVVTALPDPSSLDTPVRQAGQDLVDALARESGVDATGYARNGDPAAVVLAVAEEVGADLVVVGNKGMRGARRVLGSVPNTLSHEAPCAVLIVNTA
jgi:nucleotide-binding universal stress UspA family protein